MTDDTGYIMSLRKLVGHRPIIMTAAAVLILNDKNQLLLQRRSDNGMWAYPGGSMELGESFEECARREAYEETGLKCLELKFFTTASGKDVHYIYPNGDEIYAAEVSFICEKYEGSLKLQESEASEQRFFDLDKLPEDITPNNVGVIKELTDYMKKKGQAVMKEN